MLLKMVVIHKGKQLGYSVVESPDTEQSIPIFLLCVTPLQC